MKKTDKYINLLEDTLLTKDLDNFTQLLTAYLKADRGWGVIYYKYLKNLEREIGKHGTYADYSDSDLIDRIRETLDILQTSPAELDKKEREEARRLELADYQEKLPLKLLELMAQAQECFVNYSVRKHQDDGLKVIFSYCDIHNHTCYAEVPLNDDSYNYDYAQELVDRAKFEQEEETRKSELLQSAKSKLTQILTPEELEVLKESGL